MNWDEVFENIDREIFNKTNRHLKEVESIVLHGAWQGKTYEQMEETCQYSLSYLRQAAGPRLWKLLSEVLQRDISKTNLRVVCEQLWNEEQLSSPSFEPQLHPEREAKVDWGEAPLIDSLHGRDREMKLLQQQVIRERCRLVTVFGMGGIGKTALAIYFAQQVQAFDSVIWRSLHYVAGAVELIEDLLKFLLDDSDRVSDENIDNKISTLIEHLRREKCLIVLDTAAEIWQSGDLAGRYRQQYKGYGELLRRLGTESHQSCLLLCTREKPREVARLERERPSVYSLHLSGLATKAASIIFQEKQLSDPEQWEELIQLYRGNPLALKIVATTIQELFSGSVAAFLQQDTIVYGDIYDLLDEQFECLSVLEQEILNWLAIAFKPLSLMELRSNTRLPIDTAELIEALESLIRRSLIMRTQVQGKTLFSLYQPVIAQYAISRSIERVCEEIEQANSDRSFDQIEFMRNYALVTGDVENHSKQIDQIVIPIKNKLYRIFRDESAIESCLQAILESFANKSPLTVGYAQENIKVILEQLQLDLDNKVSTLP